MTDAVIVSTARTPIGRANKGTLVGVDAFALAQVAVGAAIERSGVPTDRHRRHRAWPSRSRAGASSPGTSPSSWA